MDIWLRGDFYVPRVSLHSYYLVAFPSLRHLDISALFIVKFAVFDSMLVDYLESGGLASCQSLSKSFGFGVFGLTWFKGTD